MFTFGHCPNQGGEAPAQKFWPVFHQVLIPKISHFILNSHNICMFSGHFLHHYHINQHFRHQKLSKNILVLWLLSKYWLILGISTWWKEGQNFRARASPPWFGQCPKVNILFLGRSSLKVEINFIKIFSFKLSVHDWMHHDSKPVWWPQEAFWTLCSVQRAPARRYLYI